MTENYLVLFDASQYLPSLHALNANLSSNMKKFMAFSIFKSQTTLDLT